MFKVIATAVLKLVVGVLGIALVLYAWYNWAPLIVDLLDFNLKAIKWACSLVPKPYGAMAESALRGALAADKAMLFAEGTGLIKGVLLLVRVAFTGRFNPAPLPRRTQLLPRR